MSDITDQKCEDTSILNKLFDHCDPYMSGQAKANDLVEKVREVWPQNWGERDSKIHLNDLVRRLDSRADNCYVERDVFVKNGLDWIGYLRVSNNSFMLLDQQNNTVSFVGLSDQQFIHDDFSFNFRLKT